jgi:hypothetical protein
MAAVSTSLKRLLEQEGEVTHSLMKNLTILKERSSLHFVKLLTLLFKGAHSNTE